MLFEGRTFLLNQFFLLLFCELFQGLDHQLDIDLVLMSLRVDADLFVKRLILGETLSDVGDFDF